MKNYITVSDYRKADEAITTLVSLEYYGYESRCIKKEAAYRLRKWCADHLEKTPKHASRFVYLDNVNLGNSSYPDFYHQPVLVRMDKLEETPKTYRSNSTTGRCFYLKDNILGYVRDDR